MRLAPVLVVAALVALAGCDLPGAGDGADARLPGVRTTTTLEEEHTCGPLLLPAGCVTVLIEKADSGCAPEVPGYVTCDATLRWNATAGSTSPGARLVAVVNGTAGPSCEPGPAGRCTVRGNVSTTHAFSGPGQEAAWTVTLQARLEGAAPGGEGSFTLRMRMLVRTEPGSAADA